MKKIGYREGVRFSYNEFHISRKVRDLCNFDARLFASSGNVIFSDMKSVREFTLLLNDLIKNRNSEDSQVSAGQINAMGLIDEIFHFMCMCYRRDVQPEFMGNLLKNLWDEYSKTEIDNLLLDFIEEFPPVEVYRGKCSPREFLERDALDIGTGLKRSNREQTLEEMILLRLACENPAFKVFNILFDDSVLQKNPLYDGFWSNVQSYSFSLEGYGPFGHDLITLLREPVLFSPESLRGQLEYIQKYWSEIIGERLLRLLSSLDVLSEEEKSAWGPVGGNGPEMPVYTYENLMQEYERYSPDKDWMPKVVLMAKTVLVWLDQLTKKYGYAINTLDQIPDAELDLLRDEGFTGLWLIGLWERSNASKRIKQICGNPEAAASAYSLFDYNIAQNIGGWDALSNLRQRLWARGIRLASDMVPNHTGMDGDWVMTKPDLFVQRRDNPYPQYTFNGENLSHDSRTSIYLEDHYYSKNDCAVVFKRVDNQTGDVRYIYHGNDGTGLPWNDTAQIDYLNPAAREAVIQEILHVARNFPIIRFDAAMVLAKKSIRRLWYPEPGHGGDIASRSEYSLSTQQFNDAIPEEFWREVVDRVAKEVPDTLLLAEAFWMMEGYFVRTLGMHRVYNSAFMNMLKKEENYKYRQTVKNTLTFDPQVLKRYVNFMNNPDEETAIAQFGDGDKYFGVCTLMVTMPGLPMFGHGQIEGFTEKYGMEYTKAYKNEQSNQYLIDRHKHDIFPLIKKRYIFANVENFLFYDLWNNGSVNENVFAYSNSCANEHAIVLYNNKYEQAAGWIKESVPYAVKNGEGEGEVVMKTRSLSEGLGLCSEENNYCIFQEHRTGLWYIRKSKEVCEKGLFVVLNGFEYQVLMNIHQVTDTFDGRYKLLYESLNGKGTEDLEVAWQEIVYKDLYSDFYVFAKTAFMDFDKIFKLQESLKAEVAKITVHKDEEVELLEDEKNKSEDSKDSVKKDSQTNISLEEVKSLLDENVKESALKFFETAIGFMDKISGVSINKETLYESFTKRILTLVKVYNAKAEVLLKDADLLKVLLKSSDVVSFVNLLCNSWEKEVLLLSWALTSDLSQMAYARRWSLDRKINQCLHETNIVPYEKDLKASLKRMFILAAFSKFEKVDKKSEKVFCYKIVSNLLSSDVAGLLCGVNIFDNISWFNKELSDSALQDLIMLMMLGSDEEDFNEILLIYKNLAASKAKSEYKTELWLKNYEVKTKNTSKKILAKNKKNEKKISEKSEKKQVEKSSSKESNKK